MGINNARAFLPWLFIMIGGTASFARQSQLQSELQAQQTELAAHQSVLSRQVQINDQIRNESVKQIGNAILKQCIENYRIDGKLAKLGMHLFAIPSLDERAKLALSNFSSEVAQNQGELQCSNPLPKSLTKGR